jgi:hypothetical protein
MRRLPINQISQKINVKEIIDVVTDSISDQDAANRSTFIAWKCAVLHNTFTTVPIMIFKAPIVTEGRKVSQDTSQCIPQNRKAVKFRSCQEDVKYHYHHKQQHKYVITRDIYVYNMRAYSCTGRCIKFKMFSSSTFLLGGGGEGYYDAVSTWPTSMAGWLVNDEWERIWKEEAVA